MIRHLSALNCLKISPSCQRHVFLGAVWANTANFLICLRAEGEHLMVLIRRVHYWEKWRGHVVIVERLTANMVILWVAVFASETRSATNLVSHTSRTGDSSHWNVVLIVANFSTSLCTLPAVECPPIESGVLFPGVHVHQCFLWLKVIILSIGNTSYSC